MPMAIICLFPTQEYTIFLLSRGETGHLNLAQQVESRFVPLEKKSEKLM